MTTIFDIMKEYGLTKQECVSALARLGLELIISNPDNEQIKKCFQNSAEKAKNNPLLNFVFMEVD